MHGAGARTDVDGFYEMWRKSVMGSCPESTQTDVWGTVDGVRAIRNDYVCTREPKTGRSSDMETVMIGGPEDIAIVQITFAHALGRKDQRQVDQLFRSVRVCDTDALDVCAKRKRVGFLATNK